MKGDDVSEKAHFMPLYVREYIADTRVLTLAEKGAYMDLLAHQWLNGSIPKTGEARRRVTGATEAEWKEVWPALAAKFPKNQNRKMERIRGYHMTQGVNGRKGGRPRKSQTETQVETQTVTQTVSETKALEVRSQTSDRTAVDPNKYKSSSLYGRGGPMTRIDVDVEQWAQHNRVPIQGVAR